ncbi:5'-adenylylsulfate reductase-like 4 isoform X2 [Mangifera indica]|uniref:5'-adenylylsulfate reductase-like 4 isoform X2 n=1 Tax=Mangifera indica TaxID=29780 RepID=UPI001CF9A9AA|nr:5'-adenylylsulfate reductase-like 4 isoform X2 [Mangifera indica]
MWMRVWEARILILLLLGRLTSAVETVTYPLCPTESITDSILGFRSFNCLVSTGFQSHDVIEGGELSLQRALNMVHKNSHDFVAVLFYASWCPFSRNFRPSFSILSSLYPSIPHFAIEESAIRPSVLSKYGVHGFPTLFLLNSSMRIRYHGSRTFGSLVAFYSDVTGFNSASLDKISLDKVGHISNQEKHNNMDNESCPFSWARSPENLLQQETYLALATAFVLLRLLFSFFPTLLAFAQYTWTRLIRNFKLGNLFEHPRASLYRAMQIFNSLREPCKRSNLQEGALNARAWASKSLATVSIGDASTSPGACGSE